MRFKNYILGLSILTTLFLIACADQQSTNPQKLAALIDRYENYESFDSEEYRLGLFTPERYQKEADFASELLEQLRRVDASSLTDSEKISKELLGFVLKDQISFNNYKRYLNPLLSDSGFHLNLNYRVRPLANYKQVTEYLEVLNAIPDYIDQHFANLRAGIEAGQTQAAIIFEGYESTYNDHIVDDFTESYFYSPFLALPENLSETQKDSVLTAAKLAVSENVIPQFKRIKTFFETEYLPNARKEIGISSVPGGAEFYQDRINFYTTSQKYSAQDIHEIGLKEVARIRKHMEQIITDLKFEGSFDDFLAFLRSDPQFYAKTPKELLMIARDMAKRADEQLPRFFKTLPRKPYGVAPVPDAIAPKYTGGRYVGTEANSTRPGYYWVNTYDLPSRTLYTLPALTVHEAVPGHHLQGSLNNELGDSIPQFRKDLYLSAYGEGWGLYTEFLAAEMGMYTTPYEEFGQLTYEMWRACRLVVDTGIHALGWTRDEVVDFMAGNTALSLHEVNTETDRYISWPGQALSYKIGELKIRELRKKAETELGSDFDIRDFHEVILGQGTVTLDILEQRINAYIEHAKG